MATYTLGSWSTSRDTAATTSLDDAPPGRHAFSPRRPLVALAVIALATAGFVVFSADAAGQEVAPGNLVLTKAHKCIDTGAGDECTDNTPGNNSNGKGCEKGLGDKKNDNGADCNDGDVTGDDDDVAGDDDDVAGDDDDDVAGDDDDDSTGGGNGILGGDDTTGDDDDTTGAPEVLGVVEENDPDLSRPHVLGDSDADDEQGATPEELAFTGLGGVSQLAMGGSSLMAAGAAMILGGRRKRFGAEEQPGAWWQRIDG